MGAAAEITRRMLDHAYGVLAEQMTNVTLDEALFIPAGGYRSALGTLKHAAGWSHVYYSFAFDRRPRHWGDLAWPRGLRDRIEASPVYLAEVLSWAYEAHSRWMSSLRDISDAEIALPRPLHWRQTAPLSEIVIMIAGHHLYHAGEINQLLATARGEAWEDGEEVEENHVSTIGHRVQPAWQRE